MPAKVSQTLKVLLEIRDDARRFRQSVEGRFERIEHRFEGLERGVAGLEGVIATELQANRAAIEEVTSILRGWRERYDVRIEDHEQRLRALERRTG